jgi:hypothetical protein
MSAKRKFWSIGILLAVAGLIIARLLPRQMGSAEMQFVLYIVGAVIALGGLGIILSSFKK